MADEVYLANRVVPDEIGHDFLIRHHQRRPPIVALIVLGVLAALGALALAAIATGTGTDRSPYARWGYSAAAAVFLLSTAQAAPVFAFASRLGRGWWGAPMRRVAELGGLAGLVSAPVLILLVLHLPDWRDRPSIWQGWSGAPHLWDSVAIVLLAMCGLALVWLDFMPDVAALRGLELEDGSGARFVLRPSSFVAPHWRGTTRQWAVLGRGQLLLGAFYCLVFVFTHLVVVSDLALSLVPRWASANMPAYQVVTSLEGGIAFCIVALWAARRFGHLERYVDHGPFHAASKILLALAPLWFYFFWAEFLTYWYGRTPDEQQLLRLLVGGSSRVPFIGVFLLCFLAPFLLLIWNPIRKSVDGVTLAAALVLAGILVDRVRLYVAAWSVAGPVARHLDTLPPARFPSIPDLLVIAGLPSTAVLLLLLGLLLVPALSLWELRAVRPLRGERRYIKTTVPMLAKPS